MTDLKFYAASRRHLPKSIREAKACHTCHFCKRYSDGEYLEYWCLKNSRQKSWRNLTEAHWLCDSWRKREEKK